MGPFTILEFHDRVIGEICVVQERLATVSKKSIGQNNVTNSFDAFCLSATFEIEKRESMVGPPAD